jgi:hypothetical protein
MVGGPEKREGGGVRRDLGLIDVYHLVSRWEIIKIFAG